MSSKALSPLTFNAMAMALPKYNKQIQCLGTGPPWSQCQSISLAKSLLTFSVVTLTLSTNNTNSTWGGFLIQIPHNFHPNQILNMLTSYLHYSMTFYDSFSHNYTLYQILPLKSKKDDIFSTSILNQHKGMQNFEKFVTIINLQYSS